MAVTKRAFEKALPTLRKRIHVFADVADPGSFDPADEGSVAGYLFWGRGAFDARGVASFSTRTVSPASAKACCTRLRLPPHHATSGRTSRPRASNAPRPQKR
jgi:hypothetical protein